MNRARVQYDYFEWMFNLVCKNKYANINLYRKLLTYLHKVEFTYRIMNDSDRATDGINLRHRFALLHDEDDYYLIWNNLDGPCSVLEMMVALAIRCEETIMEDPRIGDRTSQWFWKMIVNLGLGPMTDDCYDERYVKNTVSDFLDRNYEANGRGGLFFVRNSKSDFRKIPIWNQMMLYLDTLI